MFTSLWSSIANFLVGKELSKIFKNWILLFGKVFFVTHSSHLNLRPNVFGFFYHLGLKELLEYPEADVEETLMQTFRISYKDVFGVVYDHDLKVFIISQFR